MVPYFSDKKCWRYEKDKCEASLDLSQPISFKSIIIILFVVIVMGFLKKDWENIFIGPYTLISSAINVTNEQ